MSWWLEHLDMLNGDRRVPMVALVVVWRTRPERPTLMRAEGPVVLEFSSVDPLLA